jgi:hypothetical protein
MLRVINTNRSSFRFEVKVTTPQFGITSLSDPYEQSFLKDPEKPLPSHLLFRFRKVPSYLVTNLYPVPLLGTEASRLGNFSPSDSGFSAERFTDDTPTWMDLFNDAHNVRATVQRSLGYGLRPIPGRKLHGAREGALISIARRTRS